MSRALLDRQELAGALADLVLLIRRDGVLLSFLGGRDIGWLRLSDACIGQPIASLLPKPTADLVVRMIKRVIASRGSLEMEQRDDEHPCDLRVTAQAPDRAMCIIRAVPVAGAGNSTEQSKSIARPSLERRGFLKHFKDSISVAALNESHLAVAMILLEGITDIARVLDTKISDQVVDAAAQRISATSFGKPASKMAWYMGQLAENVLVIVMNTSDRSAIEECVSAICTNLHHPIVLGDAEFHLTAHAGVAILGRDATSPQSLLDHARTSATEARRSGSSRPHFFSDTLKLRSLARLDVTRELGNAISNRDITLRYAARHELSTGKLVALVSYLRWIDPMRGEVKPADFLRIAEATGQASALSRSMLACLKDDFASLKSTLNPHVRLSFGALRHHVLSGSFFADIEHLLAAGPVTADRLELRIAERSYLSRDVETWRSLAKLGVRLVIDEFGRQVSSLDLLARAPLWGLQLDRSWVTAIDTDPAARKLCRAVVNMAVEFGLKPIAAGVDNEARRSILAELGCVEGFGDLYPLHGH
jgi:predicted signal transduction protein with EAL and GGDEF domain